jgi:hypothetical protein
MAEADERTRRIGLNEALFRQVNERIQEVNEELAPVEEEATYQILCECGDTNCTEQLEVSPLQYEQVRSDPALFVVARGHIASDVEDVTADGVTYQIIRKRPGVPEDLAEAHDPRAS